MSDSGNNKTSAPESDYTENGTQENGSSEESHEPDTSGFVPGEPVPEGLPIYPEAVTLLKKKYE